MSEIPKKYTIDNAKNDIQNLQDQNSYDFQEIKRVDGLIKDYDKRDLQAINMNNLINKKIQDDYENIKKTIIDENVSITLNKKIDENTNKITDVRQQSDTLDKKIDEITNKITDVSSQLDNKANKDDVARISSGTPLFVNSESSMTDITKNYVNTNDGYLYTYNGTTFVKSNLKYQEMGLSDGQVTRNKTTFYKLSNKGNLFEKDKITSGKYINGSNGSWINQADLNESYYIEIDVNKSYKFNFTSHITYFDKELNRISGYATISVSPDTNVTLINVPTNAKYVRMSVYTSRLDIAVFSEASYFDYNLKNLYIDNSLILTEKNIEDIEYDGYKIKNESISREKLDFSTLSEFNNLIVKNKIQYLGYLYSIDGSKIYGDYGTIIFTVDELDLVHETYSYNFDSYITFWSSDKTFISGYMQASLGGVNKENLKNIPDNVYYIYMSIYKSAEEYGVFANAKYFKHGLKTKYKDNSLVVLPNNFNENIFSNIYDKSFLFFGDSWCVGNTSAPGGWADWLKNKHPSITKKNCGVHGADWEQCYSYWIENTEKWNSLSDDYDYIIIEAYTNGLYGTVSSLSKQLGTIDEYTYYNSVEEIEAALGNTFAKDLEKCIYKITERWVGKKIGVMFPYKSVAMLKEDNAFRVFREQVFKCCRKYNVPVFDNFDSCNIQSYRTDFVEKYYFEQDGTHLNSLGYDLICPSIESWINSL